MSEGLALQFVERIDEIPGRVGVTEQWDRTCEYWQKYDAAANPPLVDSGV